MAGWIKLPSNVLEQPYYSETNCTPIRTANNEILSIGNVAENRHRMKADKIGVFRYGGKQWECLMEFDVKDIRQKTGFLAGTGEPILFRDRLLFLMGDTRKHLVQIDLQTRSGDISLLTESETISTSSNVADTIYDLVAVGDDIHIIVSPYDGNDGPARHGILKDFKIGKEEHQIHWIDGLQHIPSSEFLFHIKSRGTILAFGPEESMEYSIAEQAWKSTTAPINCPHNWAPVMSLDERYLFGVYAADREPEITEKEEPCYVPNKWTVCLYEIGTAMFRDTKIEIPVKAGLTGACIDVITLDNREQAQRIGIAVISHWIEMPEMPNLPDSIKLYVARWISGTFAEDLHCIHWVDGEHWYISVGELLEQI